ncbi:MAG: membrane protein insertion efficiency factor YidD [Parachlamydiaceae bacterium]
MRFIAIALIRVYQWCISPLIGDVCRFTPSCSHYAVDVIKKHGFFLGGWMAVKRIVSCNPWYSKD